MAKEGDMKGTSNKRVVPELRFPEFEKDGEWEEKKLGEISNIINEKCKVKDLNIETYISTENILKDYAGITQIAKLPQTGSFALFLKGDILVANIRPYLKKIWIADFDGAASNDVIVFRSNENMNNSYVSHLIKNDDFVNYCMAGAKGVKMPRGDKEMMINYSVPTPSSTDEQQKIAECLSSIDEEIRALKEKVEQLKIHKKGLMQKLFPIVGKFVPELRFPEFEKDGEWEEKSLGGCYKLKGGYAFKSTKFQNKGIPIIRISNIPTDSLYIDLTDCVYYEDIFNNKDFLINHGDLLLAMSGATTGKTAVYNQKEPAYLNQRVGVFRSSKSNNCYSFLCQWVKTCNYDEQLSRLLTAGAQPNISSTDVETLLLQYPKNPSEQQKIAECLSSIDELISLYENKVTLLGLHKKGLMQRLFPKL